MKIKILAAILLFASFTFAQFGQANSSKRPIDKTDYYYHAHTGIYFSTSFTFGYTTKRKNKKYLDYDEKQSSDATFKGWFVPYHEVRLGSYYNEVVAFYGALGIGLGTGDYEQSESNYDKTYKKDATNLRLLVGIGAEIYPFQDKESPLYGLFFGLLGGAAFEGAEYDSKIKESGLHYYGNSKIAESETCSNCFGRVEAGYDWWFCTRWRFGTSFSYTFGGYSHEEDKNPRSYHNNHEKKEVTKNHTFALTIRIAH